MWRGDGGWGAIFAVTLALMLPAPPSPASAASACDNTGTTLVVDMAGSVRAVDPALGEPVPVPTPGRFIHQAGNGGWPPPWEIVRTPDSGGTRVVVTDRRTGDVVLDRYFERRIELAASSASPDGRYTVLVQGNNVASEVTILDAATGNTREALVPHDAAVAPFAIAIVFAPDRPCVAISMERAGGPGAETWLVDLMTGDVTGLDLGDAFAFDWLPGQDV